MQSFGFDYATPEQWVLTVDHVEIPMPIAQNGFVGVVIYQDFPSEFTLSSPASGEGSLSMDNLTYTTLYFPSTVTSTPTSGMP